MKEPDCDSCEGQGAHNLILWITLIGLGIGIPLLTLRLIDNWIDRTLDIGRKHRET